MKKQLKLSTPLLQMSIFDMFRPYPANYEEIAVDRNRLNNFKKSSLINNMKF